jgi:H+/Cl- antiporter ClcA
MATSVRIRPWTIVLIIVGVLCIVAGIVYAAQTAHAIPSFFPGHESKPTSHHHYTHAAGMFTLGVIAFIAAWMTTGTAKDTETT